MCTLGLHAHLEALLEAAELAAVAVRFGDDALAARTAVVAHRAAHRALEEALAALARDHPVVAACTQRTCAQLTRISEALARYPLASGQRATGTSVSRPRLAGESQKPFSQNCLSQCTRVHTRERKARGSDPSGPSTVPHEYEYSLEATGHGVAGRAPVTGSPK